jgi:repressor LexA
MLQQAMTPQQRKVFDSLKHYWAMYDTSPSSKALAEMLGVTPQRVHHHLKTLQRKGLIEVQQGETRSWRPVLKEADAASKRLIAFKPMLHMRCVPVLGQVAAGIPDLAVERAEGGVWVDWPHPQDVLFALRVRGDSMIKAGILSGDIVIIRQQLTFRDGDIVLALIDQEEATLKRLKRNIEKVGLFPENDTLQPRWYAPDRISLQGKVVESRRLYSFTEDYTSA